MAQMTGKFQQYKSENLEEYGKACGMPYMARKMIGVSNPSIEICKNDSLWIIKQTTFFKTTEIKFKLDEEFDEHMPGGTLKSIAVMKENKIIITSVHESGTKVTKTYEFKADEENDLIITMCHTASGQTAKRFFRKI